MASTTQTFEVAMTCGGCEKAVRAVLSKTEGVTGVDVDLASKKVVVTGNESACTRNGRQGTHCLLEASGRAASKLEAIRGGQRPKSRMTARVSEGSPSQRQAEQYGQLLSLILGSSHSNSNR